MTPDWQTDTVLFSALLPSRHPAVWGRLAAALDARRVPRRLVAGTRDVWARDYLPVQVGPGEFVRFVYRPSYLRGHDHLVTGPEVAGGLPEVRTLHDSPLVVDGGNVVASGDTVIMTDRVYRENPTVPRAAVRAELARVLRARLIVIPAEPGDAVGHADGVVRFLDDGTVLVNDYSELDPEYGRQLARVLGRAGLRVEVLPYRPSDEVRDGIPSAVGNYANFLRVGRLVLVPAHGLPEDAAACEAVARLLPGAAVVPVRCEELARDGGVLNCVGWTCRAAPDLPSAPPACDHPP